MTIENQKLLDSFIASLKASGKSENTVRAYRKAVRNFLEFIGDKPFTSIEYAEAEDFQNAMHLKGNGSSTINSTRAALSTFTKFVKKRFGKSIDLDNVFILLDAVPNERVRPLVIWGRDKVQYLIDYFAYKNVRLSTMLALALYSGRRRIELTRFKVTDFDENHLSSNGRFYVSDPIETKGRGKHLMSCYVLSEFKPYFDRWMEVRNVESEWLFPNMNKPSEHIGDDSMKNLSDMVKALPGYEDFHWHMVRHTMVTTLLDKGVDPNIVVKIIGWADTKMLAVYDDRSRESVIDKYFDEVELDF